MSSNQEENYIQQLINSRYLSGRWVLEAEATTIGIKELRTLWTVYISGVGKRFSGSWLVYRVKHRIGSNGYTCDLTLIRNAVSSVSYPLEDIPKDFEYQLSDDIDFFSYAMPVGEREVEEGSITDKAELNRILFGIPIEV